MNPRRKLRKVVHMLSEWLEMCPPKLRQSGPHVAPCPCGIGESQARLPETAEVPRMGCDLAHTLHSS